MKATINKKGECPNKSEHTPEPPNMTYVQWHEWAAGMGETQKQVRCPDCKRFVIWVKK